MQYDVFISYSRQDTPQVKSLIDRLREEIPGLKIWYDIEGIESADAFRKKIITAIDESNTIVFACSDNSLESDFCEKEIMYAKNTGKTVVPYLLPGAKLKGWLLFEFGSINCITSTKEEEVKRMIADLKRWKIKAEDDGEGGVKEKQPLQKEFSLSEKEKVSVAKDSELKIESSSAVEQLSVDIKPKANDVNNERNSVEANAENDSKTEFVDGFINGHPYVDLGLPSGLKWATYNLGATKPEEIGDYFAWGRTEGTHFGNCHKRSGLSRRFFLGVNSLSKNHELFWIEDVANKKWGSNWRTPSQADILELIEYTTSEWVTRNGVEGWLLKSKSNPNSIFLPAGGMVEDSIIEGFGSFGYYWTSKSAKTFSDFSYCLYFDKRELKCKEFNRKCEFLIRPVVGNIAKFDWFEQILAEPS